jgi:hypothetical protein
MIRVYFTFILLILTLSTGCSDKSISWRGPQALTFEDFKGKAKKFKDEDGIMAGRTYCMIALDTVSGRINTLEYRFLPKRSYINYALIHSFYKRHSDQMLQVVLAHENTHFDIIEYCCRVARSHIALDSSITYEEISPVLDSCAMNLSWAIDSTLMSRKPSYIEQQKQFRDWLHEGLDSLDAYRLAELGDNR